MCTTLTTAGAQLWCALRPRVGERSTGTGTNSRRQLKKEGQFLWVGVEEVPTPAFPVKTAKKKVSFPIASAHRISSPHGHTLRDPAPAASAKLVAVQDGPRLHGIAAGPGDTTHGRANRQLTTVEREKCLLPSSLTSPAAEVPPSLSPALELAGSAPERIPPANLAEN